MKRMVVYTAYYDKKPFLRYFDTVKSQVKIDYVDDLDALLEALPGAQGLITIPFDSAMLQRADTLQWVQCLRAGVDNYPLDAMEKKQITLTNAKGIHRVHMAEYAIGMMIAKKRRFFEMYKNQLAGQWKRKVPQDEIAGSTVAILGLGAIGREVAKKAHLMGMQVLGVKRSKEAVPYVDELLGEDRMIEAFGRSDFVINLLPAIDSTHKLIGKEHFDAMKEGATFMNLGRGKTVDEETLIAALNSRDLTFMSDVFYEEPLAEDSPLWALPNVVITPHICGESIHYLEKCLEVVERNLPAWLSGDLESMVNRIDLTLGY